MKYSIDPVEAPPPQALLACTRAYCLPSFDVNLTEVSVVSLKNVSVPPGVPPTITV